MSINTTHTPKVMFICANFICDVYKKQTVKTLTIMTNKFMKPTSFYKRCLNGNVKKSYILYIFNVFY